MSCRPRWASLAALATPAIVLAWLATADAHRAPGSLSTIEYNPRSDKTEIVHRLHSHDAELGVAAAIEQPRLSVVSMEGRAYIALYVEERFAIESEEGPLPLSLVGAELAADYLLVYQEMPGALPDTIRVRDDILRDVFPEQINQVNIEANGAIRSLVFANDDDWRLFELPPGTP